MTATVASTELRAHLSDVLSRVGYGRARVYVERNGTPVAAIVPLEDLELLERLYDAADREAAEQAFAAYVDEAFADA